MREFVSVLLLICGACVYGHPDEIEQLPGLEEIPGFLQYSGYLNASNGKYLHYWFVESQRSPSTDPVVLWMNGGPGCSSLGGFLTELGPFHLNPDGKTLYANPYSWNKVANVIFLEAPAGVGFSYSDSEQYATDDDITSSDNYLALQHFFDKFPQFKNNDFYITGESYGGIYIPTLSVRVLMGPANINFKGFAIGNGFLDQKALTTSIVFFAYYHGLLGQSTWDGISKYCCNGTATRSSCDFTQSVSTECEQAVNEALVIVQSSGLNIYNLYSDCAASDQYLGNGISTTRDSVDKRRLLKSFNFHHEIIADSPPCIDDSNMTNYLNQDEVRKALHIPASVQEWQLCSLAVETGYKTLYKTMRPQILQLIGSQRLRGLIYNGDVDMACNFLGDEWFFDDLNMQDLEHYHSWLYNGQIAGFTKRVKNLTYATIKGSGHMVPQDKPGPAYKMINSFLSNIPLK